MNDSLAALNHVCDLWVAQTRPEVEAGTLSASHCILAARTIGAVLDQLHPEFEWTPIPCTALATNTAAERALAAGLTASEFPPGAWSVGVVAGARLPERGWEGHLVLAVDTPDGRYLVDGSTGQFTRRHRGLILPDAVVADADGWVTTRGNTVIVGGPDFKLEYRAEIALLGRSYRSSNDWRRNWRPRAARILDEVTV